MTSKIVGTSKLHPCPESVGLSQTAFLNYENYATPVTAGAPLMMRLEREIGITEVLQRNL